MIRFKCPKCQKAMGVDDSKAGALGMCPGCRATFRIPAAAAPPVSVPAPAPPPLQSQVSPAPLPPVRSAPPPHYDDDASTYAVQLEAEAQDPVPVQKRLPTVVHDYETDDDDDEADYRARRRARRSGRGFSGDLIPGLSNFALVMIILGIGWIFLGGLTLLLPIAGLMIIGAGILIGFISHVWMVKIAFEDGAGTGLAFLFVPFYSLMFIFSNLDRCGVPLLINLVGTGYIITGFVSLAIHAH
jgi:hypothetical protein